MTKTMDYTSRQWYTVSTPPIAQLVERRPFKPTVPGSNPGGRTFQYKTKHTQKGG